MQLALFNYAEILALAASIIYYKGLSKTPYIWLLPYLSMTVAAELIGQHLATQQLYVYNIRLFNVTTVIEFVIFFYLFYRSLSGGKLKTIVLCMIPLYIVLAVVNQIFIQGFNTFHTNTMLIGTVLIIICVFFYFYEAFGTTEPVHLLHEPMFWISIGVFLFYLGDFTNNLMQPYLFKHHMVKEWRHLIKIINNNLIILEYICISIAIVICSRNTNRSALKLQS